ncbi:MAG: type VI secretion system tip protein TssI/VgrG [Opitutaceae bacterium]
MPAATFTQANRSLEIQTPLGENILGLRSILVQEQLGRPYVIEAELSSDAPDVKFDAIIGQPVVIRLDQGGGGRRFYHGFVSRFVLSGHGPAFTHYRATIVPWLWVMTRSADCRIFQDMTAPEIVQSVFADRGAKDVELRITGTYPKRLYCVQYRETDFNFVSRLLEEEGITYFFKHEDDKVTLVLVDDMASYETIADPGELRFTPIGGAERQMETITQWTAEQELQPTQYSLSDYNYLKPKTPLLKLSQVEKQHAINDRQIFDFPGDYLEPAEGERLTRTRLEEIQTGSEIARAETQFFGISAGALFTLKEHPRDEQNRKYLVTSVNLFWDAGEFTTQAEAIPQSHCHFTAIPATQTFRPARVTPKPLIQGPQSAMVVGPAGEEIHTDEHGRVKVHFFWNRESKGDDKSSAFVRVSQSWAGKKWGTFFLPRIGHEVLVEFMEGDPDRPVVTGSVYNADNKPPYDLPANKTKSMIKTLSSKGGGGYNELRFEDMKGCEEIFLHAEKNLEVRVKAAHQESVGGVRDLHVHGDTRTKLHAEHHLHVVGNEYAAYDADRHLKVTGNTQTKVDGNLSLEVGGDRMTKITGTDNLKVEQDLSISSTGVTSISASDIYLKAGGNIGLDAKNIHLKASSNIVIEAGSNVTLVVGGDFIAISGGITQVGATVKINSGGAPAVGAGCSPLDPAAPDPPDPKDPGGPPTGKPGEITTFSSAAQALKYAALTGLPFCEDCPREQPPPTPVEPPPAKITATAEIEINNSPDSKDDLVRLVGGTPPVRHLVPARIRLTSESDVDVPVVLTNPDGKLRFPNTDNVTLSLSLPATGDFVPFQIAGEKASAGIGDAKIEAHQDTAEGAKIAEKGVTVFSFDPNKLTITNPGTYQLSGGRYTATGGNAANYSAEGKLKPAGVDCSAPQVSDLRIGIMQNDVTSGDGVVQEWDRPTMIWDAGTAVGTTVNVPSFVRRVSRLPVACNDVAPTVAPLYDQPGKGDTLDPNSLKPPTGCPGGGPATSFDTPSAGAPATFDLRASDASGTEVGTARYRLKRVRVIGIFKTWTVAFNPTDNTFETLRERGWKVDVSSDAAAAQKATTDAADAAPTTVPVLAPTANTVVNDPANRSIEQGPPTPFTR